MVEAIGVQSKRMDEVVHLFFGLLRPQGPPPSGPGMELTMGQLRLLLRLRHEGPAAMGSVAKAADRSLRSTTALVERIERQGLVRRERREVDRRVVVCQITESGRQLVDEIAGHRAATLRQALSVLDPEEIGQLHGLLGAMMSRQSSATLADTLPATPGTRSGLPAAAAAGA